MKVTVATDSFRGSLTTHMAGEAIACGIIKKSGTAVIEMAAAAGITLISIIKSMEA